MTKSHFRASPNKKGGEAATISAFPAWEGGPRQRRSGSFVNRLLETLFPTLFHTACALSAPSGHLPRVGKATIREYPLLKKAARHPCEAILSPSTVIPSAAEGSLWHCRHMHACALTQATPWCFPLSPFSHSRFTSLQEGSLHFAPHDTQERRIVSHPLSYRYVDPSCTFGAPLL